MIAVEDVHGSLVDSSAGGQVLEQIAAEQEHESGDIERRGRLAGFITDKPEAESLTPETSEVV